MSKLSQFASAIGVLPTTNVTAMFLSSLVEFRGEYEQKDQPGRELDFAFEFVNKDGASTRFPIHRELIALNRYLRWCFAPRGGNFVSSDLVTLDARDFFCGEIMTGADVEQAIRSFYGYPEARFDYRQRLVQVELALRLHCYPLVLSHAEKLLKADLMIEYANYAFKLLSTYIERPELITSDTIGNCTQHADQIPTKFLEVVQTIVQKVRSVMQAEYASAQPGSMVAEQFQTASTCCDDLLVSVVSDPLFPVALMSVRNLVYLHGFGWQIIIPGQYTFIVNIDAVLSQYIFEYGIVIGRYIEVSRIYRRLVTACFDYKAVTMSRSMRLLRVFPSTAPPEPVKTRARLAYVNWPQNCLLTLPTMIEESWIKEFVLVDHIYRVGSLIHLDLLQTPPTGCLFRLPMRTGATDIQQVLDNRVGTETSSPVTIAALSQFNTPKIDLLYFDRGVSACTMLYFCEFLGKR